MAWKMMVVAIGMIAAASPVSAVQPQLTPEAGAPLAPPDARYCLRIEAITGSRIEQVLCETREGWARLEVDLDEEWAKEGVRIMPPARQET